MRCRRSPQLGVAAGDSATLQGGDLSEPGTDGLTLHQIVDDVDAATEVAKSHGAQLVLGPVDLDSGMRFAVLKGPGCC
jgi:predicted enzyme related to lactoylglutathione lyase